MYNLPASLIMQTAWLPVDVAGGEVVIEGPDPPNPVLRQNVTYTCRTEHWENVLWSIDERQVRTHEEAVELSKDGMYVPTPKKQKSQAIFNIRPKRKFYTLKCHLFNKELDYIVDTTPGVMLDMSKGKSVVVFLQLIARVLARAVVRLLILAFQ